MELKTLPSKIYKLVNLRSLDLSNCGELTHVPSGIGRLTLLHKLPMFIVGHETHEQELRKKPTSTGKLSDLKKLNNLKGCLRIYINRSLGNTILEALEADITSKHGLVSLYVSFEGEMALEVDKKIHDETMLESLKPHGNLRMLYIENYEGEKLVMDSLDKTVPNLVDMELTNWSHCQQLPSLSQLRFLKELSLENLERVEYIESSVLNLLSESQGLENSFLPCLQSLELKEMKNLKGWWKEVENDETIVGASLQFSNLEELTIENCPKMMKLPLCPNLIKLSLRDTNKKLLSLIRQQGSVPSASRGMLKLEELEIDDAEDLISLSQVGLGRLKHLDLSDTKLQSTELLGETFETLSSSLRTLRLQCKSLRSISKGLEHLTRLETLLFNCCEELDVSATDDMPWKALKSSLRKLELGRIPKLVSLPSGMQHLINLRCLQLNMNFKLTEVPEWISCLSSLEVLSLLCCLEMRYLPEGLRKLTSIKELSITDCPGLTERCQEPNGSEWPKIQHIPNVRLSHFVLPRSFVY